MAQMEVLRPKSADEFLERAGEFLRAREAVHNLPLGLCSRLRTHPLLYGEEPYFAVAVEGGDVVGATVSMGGYGGSTPNGGRIGPIYTPPELRRRGYASALTAELTQMLLDRGRRFCFLFTDLANPTSNSIYQQIGYRP